jgi:hypothetical protein
MTGRFRTTSGVTAADVQALINTSLLPINASLADISARLGSNSPSLPTVGTVALSTTSPAVNVTVTITAPTLTGGSPNNTVTNERYQIIVNGSIVQTVNKTGATDSFQVSSAWAALSGVVRYLADHAAGSVTKDSAVFTVGAAPAFSASAPPSFPATVTLGSPVSVTDAAWSGGSPTFVSTRIYVDNATTPYATITAHPSTYTPLDDSFMQAQTGLASLVGHTVYCDQQVTFNSVTYTSAKSTGRVVQAAAAGLTVLVEINAANNFNTISGGSVQLLGGSQSLPGVSQANGITGTGTITGPSTVGTSTLRFGNVEDPVNAGRRVFYFAAKSSDPATFGHSGRVEIEINNAVAIQKTGKAYWFALESYVPTVLWNDAGSANILQIHTPDATSIFGPFSLTHSPAGGIFPNNNILVDHGKDPNVETYPFASDNSGFNGGSATDGKTMPNWNFSVNTWHKWVFKYRGDPTGSLGFLQGWVNVGGVTTQILDLQNVAIGLLNVGGGTATPDYVKFGMDAYGTGGGSGGTWALARSIGVYEDNGNTVSDVLARMT